MRQLFLHVGTHKTGTKSFQAYLVDHLTRIRSQGVAVATERHPRLGLLANCFSLPNAVLRPGLMTIARMTGIAKTPGFWQRARSKALVTGFLLDRTAARFVLSAEGFCFARDSGELVRIKALFSAPDLEVIPVVCLRADDAWRASWLGQVERLQPHYRLPHGQGINDIRGDWYFDKREILRFWQQVGPVRTVDFDAAVRQHGTIIPDLLAAMEIEDCGGAGDYFLNVSERAA